MSKTSDKNSGDVAGKKPVWFRIISIVLVSVLSIITILVLLSPLNFAGLKPQIEARASAALGRPVTLDGSIEASFGLNPVITLGGVHLASVDAKQEALTLSGIEARVRLLPLLTRRIRGNLRVTQLSLSPMGQIEPTLVIDGLSVEASRDQTIVRADGGLLGQTTSIDLHGGPLEALGDDQSPWPIGGEATWGSLTAQVSGELQAPVGSSDMHLEATFSVVAQDAAQFGLGDTIHSDPTESFLALQGRVEFDGETARLELVESRVGHTRLDGSMQIETATGLNKIKGRVTADRIDLAAWADALPASSDAKSPEAGSDSLRPEDLFPPIEGQVDLLVGELTGLPLNVDQITIPLVFERDRITVEAAGARIATAPVGLSMAVERVQDGLTLSGSVDIAGVVLTEDTQPLNTINGGIKRISGAWRADWLDTRSLFNSIMLDVDFDGLDLAYQRGAADTRAIPIALPHSRLSIEDGQLRYAATGTILDIPVNARARFGRPAGNPAPRAAWDFSAALEAGGAALNAEGTARDGQLNTHLSIDLPDPALLSTWLGDQIRTLAPVAAEANLRWQPGSVALENLALTVGDQHASGQLAITGTPEQRRLAGELDLDFLKLDALIALLKSSAGNEANSDKGDPGLTLDMPILPERLNLPDADLTVTAQQVAHPRLPLSDFSFHLLLEDGAIQPSAFQAQAFGAEWEGSLQFDGHSGTPMAELSLNGSGIQLARLGKDLAIGDLPQIEVDRMQVQVLAKGSALDDMLALGRTELTLEGVRWPEHLVNLDRLNSAAGQGTHLLIGDGSVGPLPASFNIELPSIASLFSDDPELPMSMEIRLADATLGMNGSFIRPISAANLEFKLSLHGESVSAFTPLAGKPLPPIGPYDVSASVQQHDREFTLNNFKATVGQTDLSGSLFLDRSQPLTRVRLDLDSQRFQIDDFFWDTGQDAPVPEAGGSDPDDKGRIGAQLLGKRWDALGFLDDIDVRLNLAAASVRSGKDDLGGGQLGVQASDTYISIDPLVLDLPGGRVDMAVSLAQVPDGLRGSINMEIQQFDFGVLARRVKPESPVSGRISLGADLETEGPDLRGLLAGANGTLDIGIWPVDMSANVFDLWAVGLLTALLPSLDAESGGSVFNCAVVRMRAEDGVMRNEALLLDTSRITAGGNLEIDFRSEILRLAMKSRPKRPALFSAQPPIQVEGSFDDFRVGLASGAGIGAMIRILASPLTFPFELLLNERLPEDGEAACRQAFQQDEPGS